jgi:predicted TIM-barrel fold metal-dependent hydrolase
MIIDFHTHIFPDKIAEKSLSALQDVSSIKAFTNGTLDGLKSSMLESNIDISVVLPVVTRPAQFDTVNSFAAEVTGRDGIISFGGIHPDTEDYIEKLDQIKGLGLPGIKLHPDYQDTFIDDPKNVQIIQYAVKLGLMVIIHAGLDIGLPDPVHCPPERTANMLRQIEDESAKIILAHMGGYDLWDAVEEFLVGRNIILDTSYCFGKMSDEQFVRIVRNHGADRILFASDSPWGGQKESLEYIKKLDFTEEEIERILYRNAAELLSLELS